MIIDEKRSGSVKAFLILSEGEVYPSELRYYVKSEGRHRIFKRYVCLSCDCVFYSRSPSSYCSGKCTTAESRITITCYTCKKQKERPISKLKNSKNGVYFCSRKCKDTAQSINGGCKEIQPSHYTEEGTGYRKIAFAAFGKKCANCGYDGSSKMLDVHHIDGDRKNNKAENLRVLCVWCHALLTREKWSDE